MFRKTFIDRHKVRGWFCLVDQKKNSLSEINSQQQQESFQALRQIDFN